MPSINDVCYIVAVTVSIGILVFVILGDFNYFSADTPLWKLQLVGSAAGAMITAIATIGAMLYKNHLDNISPLEFRVGIKQRDDDKYVKFTYSFKNNIKSKIKIAYYHIDISKAGIDKPLSNFCMHHSKEIIYVQDDWQERPFGWVPPSEYEIKESGVYNIVVTIIYRYKDENKMIFDAITENIEAGNKTSAESQEARYKV